MKNMFPALFSVLLAFSVASCDFKQDCSGTGGSNSAVGGDDGGRNDLTGDNVTQLCLTQKECDTGIGGALPGGRCLYFSCRAPAGTCQPFEDGGSCGFEGGRCCHTENRPAFFGCAHGFGCEGGICVRCPGLD